MESKMEVLKNKKVIAAIVALVLAVAGAYGIDFTALLAP